MHGHVEDVQRVAPHLVRVVLGGPGLAGFAMAPHTDSYVNVALPVPGAPYSMPCDLAATRGLPRELRPSRRRYTVRAWDEARRRLSLDFVVHGASGAAGPWAAAAQAGDVLQLEGPAGGYSPDAGADWHLMVGDESALPAIAASLERVGPGTRVCAFLEVGGPEDHVELTSAGDVRVTWLHRDEEGDEMGDGARDEAGDGAGDEVRADLLAPAVAQATFPAGRLQGFVHGEAAMVRGVRRHLLTERGVTRVQLSASPYWRRGLDDEAWRAVKKQWLADQDSAPALSR